MHDSSCINVVSTMYQRCVVDTCINVVSTLHYRFMVDTCINVVSSTHYRVVVETCTNVVSTMLNLTPRHDGVRYAILQAFAGV